MHVVWCPVGVGWRIEGGWLAGWLCRFASLADGRLGLLVSDGKVLVCALCCVSYGVSRQDL